MHTNDCNTNNKSSSYKHNAPMASHEDDDYKTTNATKDMAATNDRQKFIHRVIKSLCNSLHRLYLLHKHLIYGLGHEPNTYADRDAHTHTQKHTLKRKIFFAHSSLLSYIIIGYALLLLAFCSLPSFPWFISKWRHSRTSFALCVSVCLWLCVCVLPSVTFSPFLNVVHVCWAFCVPMCVCLCVCAF